METNEDIYKEIKSVIPSDLWTRYNNLSYREMAKMPELAAWSTQLLDADLKINRCRGLARSMPNACWGRRQPLRRSRHSVPLLALQRRQGRVDLSMSSDTDLDVDGQIKQSDQDYTSSAERRRDEEGRAGSVLRDYGWGTDAPQAVQ